MARQTNNKINNLDNQSICIKESKSNDILKSNDNGLFQEVHAFSNESVNSLNEIDSDGNDTGSSDAHVQISLFHKQVRLRVQTMFRSLYMH